MAHAIAKIGADLHQLLMWPAIIPNHCKNSNTLYY